MHKAFAASCVAVLTGCASAPNFEPEREQLFSRTDVLCWIASIDKIRTAKPEEYKIVTAELAERKALCTADQIENGRLGVLAQFAHEKSAKEEASRKNARTAESVLRGAALIGGILLLAPALAPPMPPPPKPIQCHTSYTYGGANTTCY